MVVPQGSFFSRSRPRFQPLMCDPATGRVDARHPYGITVRMLPSVFTRRVIFLDKDMVRVIALSYLFVVRGTWLKTRAKCFFGSATTYWTRQRQISALSHPPPVRRAWAQQVEFSRGVQRRWSSRKKILLYVDSKGRVHQVKALQIIIPDLLEIGSVKSSFQFPLHDVMFVISSNINKTLMTNLKNKVV